MSKTKTYTLEDLAAMPKDEAMATFLKAVKIEGSAVVRRADGSIKYDDPALAGTYKEAKDGSGIGDGST